MRKQVQYENDALSKLYYAWLFLRSENFVYVCFRGTINYYRTVQEMGMEQREIDSSQCFLRDKVLYPVNTKKAFDNFDLTQSM